MTSSMDLRLKQRAVIEFLTTEGCRHIEIYSRMKAVYGEMCTVRRWIRRSREENPSESTVHDQARTGRPLSASDSKHQSRVDQWIRENRRVKQIDISIEIGISQERVHHVFTNLLGYKKVSARWVPRMLTPHMKLQRVQICRELWQNLMRMVKTSSVKLSLGMNPGFIIMILNRSNSRRSIDTKRHHLRKNSKCFLPHGRCFSRSFGTLRVWFTQNFRNKATP